MAMNFGQLAFNASAKDLLLAQGVPDRPAVFGAAAIAGFFAAFFSLPCLRHFLAAMHASKGT